MIIVILPKLFFKSFQGMAVFPFIFLRNKELKLNPRIINHERIHLRQQIELLWIFFFLIYFLELIYYYIKLGNGMEAYKSISFEREAYSNDHNLKYLKKRKLFNSFKYIKNIKNKKKT